MAHKPFLLLPRVAAATLISATLLGIFSTPSLATSTPPSSEPSITWSMSPANDAQNGNGHWVDIELSPGQTTQEQLVLKNHSEQQVTFGLQAADGYFTQSGRFNMLASNLPSSDAGTWISVQDQVTVAAKSSEIVSFTVTVPDNATPGDHAAGIASVISSVGHSADGASVGLESRIGFRVMTRVDGPLNPSLALDSIDAGYSQSWNPFSPGEITLDFGVSNDGNLQLEPTTSVSLPFGNESAALTTAPLLPGDVAEVSVNVSDSWPIFLTPATVEVTGADSSGEQQILYSQRVWVWTLPLPQLLVLAGASLCLFGLRRRKTQQDARLEELLEQAREDGAAQAELRHRKSVR